MINQLSLFMLLLAPVVTYAAGAVLISVFKTIPQRSSLTKRLTQLTYRNGH